MAAIGTTLTYVEGSSLPDAHLWWPEPDGSGLIDYSSGYTFTAEVGVAGSAATYTATGLTGAAGSGTGAAPGDVPNLVWAHANTGEITTLAAGDYTVEVTATRTSDSKTRRRLLTLTILDGLS